MPIKKMCVKTQNSDEYLNDTNILRDNDPMKKHVEAGESVNSSSCYH